MGQRHRPKKGQVLLTPRGAGTEMDFRPKIKIRKILRVGPRPRNLSTTCLKVTESRL
jgi:hypothetical protein